LAPVAGLRAIVSFFDCVHCFPHPVYLANGVCQNSCS
jgi:hypothetical protein